MRNRRSASRPTITPEQILAGYQQGYFPMARGFQGPIDWFVAEPRTIIPLDERFKVRRSLRKTMRKAAYDIRIDTAFVPVIRACARHHQLGDDEIWLSEEMIELYAELHRRGFAHSVEVWNAEGQLVGGLYGVALGSVFHGESMFHHRADASKVGFATLVARLAASGYRLIDCQVPTAHLASLGAFAVTRADFLEALRLLRDRPPAADAFVTPASDGP